MTPAQLRTYAAVVRYGSAKAAAAELGVTEAAVSAHTAALRKQLDDPLYHRSGNGLAFTPGGLRLATRASELLGLQDQTREEVRAASQGRRVLRLATTTMFAEFAAAGLIELFRTRANDLEVELSVHSGADFGELLASRQADVTIGPERSGGPGSDGGGGRLGAPTTGPGGVVPSAAEFQSYPFLRYQLVPVVALRHPLAGGRPSTARLRETPWLLGPSIAERGGATAHFIERFAVPEAQQRIFQSHEAALAEATEGKGLALAPEFRVKEAVSAGRLKTVVLVGGAVQATWVATTLDRHRAKQVATELGRFVTTPRAIQAMLSGSGTNVGRFRPRVHVTLWS
jgi:DNA-binding transcriptional LysR family regulator